MEFSVTKSALLNELTTTQGVVERKTTIPILSFRPGCKTLARETSLALRWFPSGALPGSNDRYPAGRSL
jgi:hypothetical protein